MATVIAGARERAPHRGVHRFGAAGGEDDFTLARTEPRRDLLAGGFDRHPGGVPLGVQASGIGMVLAQVGEHRLEGHRT